MALLCNQVEYIGRMNSALKEKSILLNYIKGNTILDFGCGSGILTALIAATFPEKEVTGFDESADMIREAQLTNDEKIFFTNSLSIYKQHYDTIILCSVLHEVYSYGRQELSVYELFNKLKKMLNPGGRILVRDGFLLDGYNNRYAEVEFVDKKDGMSFLSEYIKNYRFEEVPIAGGNGKIVGYLNPIKEFLNKYTWGWNSLPREINEKVSFFYKKDFEELGSYFKFETETITVCQEEYFKYLDKKVILSNKPWDTTILVIYTDRRTHE